MVVTPDQGNLNHFVELRMIQKGLEALLVLYKVKPIGKVNSLGQELLRLLELFGRLPYLAAEGVLDLIISIFVVRVEPVVLLLPGMALLTQLVKGNASPLLYGELVNDHLVLYVKELRDEFGPLLFNKWL